jgi:hypothetical protein
MFFLTLSDHVSFNPLRFGNRLILQVSKTILPLAPTDSSSLSETTKWISRSPMTETVSFRKPIFSKSGKTMDKIHFTLQVYKIKEISDF